jgi:thiamine-monophosphate kinase
MSTLEESGEERLIGKLFRPIAKHWGALGLKDDAALLTPLTGHDLVLTVDAIVEGVHFFPDDAADLVARKALRVNLSDLAAKGAEPAGALLSLAVSDSASEQWLESFARGLGEDCSQFHCPLLGGDTTRTPGPVTISITAFGAVPTGGMVRRDGGRAGDAIVVTGTIGDSALGLLLRRERIRPGFANLSRANREHLTDRYLLPRPRTALAQALRDNASAAIDISDGLVGDVGKLAAVSGLSARIDARRVPLSAAALAVVTAEPAQLQTVLTGGDDYEIVAAVPHNRLARFEAQAGEAGLALTTIGRMEEGEGVEVTGRDGKPLSLPRASFSHF